LARCDGEVVAGKLSEMMGDGRLVITVEPKKGEPYQGVVSLAGDKLADVIISYFLQSEQLETKVWLFADETHAAGLFLQELPAQENYKDDWERVSVLANTVTKDEMLSLDSEEILYRLFNEEKVRLFEAEPVTFECSCSQKKIEGTLLTLGREELEGILQELSTIDVGCDFCGKKYSFDEVDVKNILYGRPVKKVSQRQH
jgi:molecular chaperone Hsp33